jgi:hypothetical protein
VPFDFSTASYEAPATTGLAWAFVSIAVLGVGLGSAVALMFLRARALRRTQQREHATLHERADRPLFAGPGHVVTGKVELDGGQQVGFEIDIVQQVKNHTSKNSRWHTWDEVSRKVRPGSFYLVREGAAPVYVEPSEDALVVDTLDTSYPSDMPNQRVRTADVKVGEEFFAYGDLVEAPHPRAHDAYRGSIGWVLKPPRRGRMLLATEGIRDRYQKRISTLQNQGLLFVALLCLSHALFTLPFLCAAVVGTRTTTHVTRTNTFITKNKNTTTRHYQLITRTADGFALDQEVPFGTYDNARRAIANGETVTVPLIRTFDSPWASYVGADPYISSIWILLGAMTATIAVIIARVRYLAAYSWYDRKKLAEHGGSGHWVEPRPAAAVPPGTN